MSAVRMVAYGVLEMKHKESPASLWLSEQSPAEQERLRQEDFERDQLRKLVKDELSQYGLSIVRTVVPKGSTFRTRMNQHTLYGQVQGNSLFKLRPVLKEGTFRECCEVAAKLLDELDAAQVPDVKT